MAARPMAGDSARFHKADDTDRKALKLTRVDEANDGVWISLPQGFGVGDLAYLIQTKAMSKRYPPLLPKDLNAFRRRPGRDTAPSSTRKPVEKKTKANSGKKSPFPDGLYAAVSRIEDLFILQSNRPVRVLLNYTREAAKRLLRVDGEALPFPKNEIVLNLDPFFTPSDEERLNEELPRLMDSGYRSFMINNLGQYALLRDSGANLAAGPYLYTFNRWAFDFVSDFALSPIVAPLEISRQNLDRTIDLTRRADAMVCVFAYPALFRVRADLSELYKFGVFSDSRDDEFRLVSTRDGSRVYPKTPFSIVDKLPYLREAGFKKFILDFSGPPLRKRDYKDVMSAAETGRPLDNISRFNWKDGFFNNEEAESVEDQKRKGQKRRGVESGSARKSNKGPF